MKSFTASVAVAALAVANVDAFPSLMTSGNSPLVKRALENRQATPPQGAGALPNKPPAFDATSQYVSNTGDHAFVAPTSTDMRGECPGLNALANHAYLPRNGYATVQQFIDGTYAGFGMAEDLAGFLAYYGAWIDGNGQGWSIGGVPAVPAPATAQTAGIGGSHHNYECDSSPIRSDLNQYGSNEKFVMEQFMNLYNMQPNAATANYNLEVMRAFRGSRFQESINKNPFFYYGPFDGIEVSQAAFTFIYRFMSNKSAEYPEGILNKDTLKSFMSVSGPENNLTHTPGHERFPDNFYKRNDGDTYSVPYFEADILYIAEKYPEILSVGCNLGKSNTYVSVPPTALSGGSISSAQASARPFCYGTAMGLASAAVSGLSLTKVAGLNAAIAPYLKQNGCNLSVKSLNTTGLALCPGFTFYGGPTGPVAPGAIQS